MSQILTETRKADRRKMLDIVAALIVECGATIINREDEPDCFLGPRACLVTLETAERLQLTIDFDGESCQPNIHVLSWHIGYGPNMERSEAKLSPVFAQSVNNYHWQKATDICEGFEALCECLRNRLASVRDGDAFQKAP